MENLITLEIEESKKEAFLAMLDLFNFVEIQDNAIWKEIIENENMLEMKKEDNKKPKKFTDFSFKDVQNIFKLKTKQVKIFEDIVLIKASDWLEESLMIAKHKTLRTEKDRSEALIYPIISEVQKINHFSFRVFSGEFINVDADKGLKGELDFAFVNDENAQEINAPIFTIVEAKQGDITKHWGQIAAQMVGAKEENAKEGNDLEAIFGCISTGEAWHFTKLENDCIYIDERPFSIYTELEKILGIFQYIVDFYKK